MQSSDNILEKMLDWIYANTDAKNQQEVAQMASISPTSISRIMKGRVKSASPETLRAINAAFGNVFNAEWIRGRSDVMLAGNQVPHKGKASKNVHQSALIHTPDVSSMMRINGLIAAKDETIEALKSAAAAKEETIAELRGRLDDKDCLVREKQARIASLERELYELRLKKGGLSGQHPTGAAEPEPANRRQ